MRRFLMAKLEKWHEKTNRKPLVLSGARQVGKTWLLIPALLRENFIKCAYEPV